jgi:hypothetical protein
MKEDECGLECAMERVGEDFVGTYHRARNLSPVGKQHMPPDTRNGRKTPHMRVLHVGLNEEKEQSN